MTDLDNARARLSNIQTVEPILGALRTISLGSWQTVITQQRRVHLYEQRLLAMLPTLLPLLAHQRRTAEQQPHEPQSARRTVLLAIGTERGLCGPFNVAILQRIQQYLAERGDSSAEVELVVLGGRLARMCRRAGHRPARQSALSVTSLPPFLTAFQLAADWLADYEAYRLESVDVIYNAYERMGAYRTTVDRLLPFRLDDTDLEELAPWPTPQVDTDPNSLYARVVEQLCALHLFRLLLSSAAAEHSVRYQLMESATQNADRLIEELTMSIQSARRQAITREMQELAAGARLIGPQR